jgi:hypothetical protein
VQVCGVAAALMKAVLPDSLMHFSTFVLLLFAFGDLLRSRTIAHCLFYMNEFYLVSKGSLFITQFPSVAGDSELVSRAFHHLHTVTDPHWVDFIAEKGNSERFSGLFIGHLTVPKDEILDFQIELNLFLCHLLLDLVLGNKGLQMQVKIAMMLFKAVLGAIDAFMEDCSLTDV